MNNQTDSDYSFPGEDYLEYIALDINQTVIKNPSATFFGRVKGYSMKDAGVDDGDLLVIDKSLPYRKDALAVCFINGAFTLKRINIENKILLLMPANPEFQPIEVKEDDQFMVWGIVSYVIKKTW